MDRKISPRKADLALAARLREGDEAAFAELHRLYARRLFAFAVKRVRCAAEAEDVVQDTFLQVHRSIARYEGRSSLLTWMFGIAHHQACNRFRRHRLETAAFDDEIVRVADPGAPVDRRVDASRALRRCADLLESEVSPAQQQIFALRHAGARSVAQIAREVNKSDGAVRIGLLRTRRALREAAPEVGQFLAAS